MKSNVLRTVAGALLALLAACTAPPTARAPLVPTVLIPPTLAATALSASVSEATATPAPVVRGVWIDPLLPADTYDSLRRQLDAVAQLTAGADALTMTTDGMSAVVRVTPCSTQPATKFSRRSG